MSTLLIDVLGWVGALAVLAAYALVSTGRSSGTSPLYQSLNIVGALLLILNSGYYGAFPSLGVNVVWIGIGVVALAASRRPPRLDPPMSAIPSARFRHVNLIARDWRSLASFYERVFGCEPVPPERDYSGSDLAAATCLEGARLRGAHLRLPGVGADGPTLEVYTYDAPRHEGPDGPDAVHRPGFGHIAFAVGDVEAARRAVLDAGGSAIGDVVDSVPREGQRVTWCYCRDPEGNVVELQRWG